MVKRIIILLFVFSSMLSFGQANRFAGFGQRSTCPVEALKFIDSSGITNQTEKDAICTLVKQLKDSSLWTSMLAIYPFVGGTASSSKWNLVNPVNSNSAFRLDFFGGWTFASTGAKPNGINAYAITYFVPFNSWASDTSISFGYYSTTNTSATQVEMGIDAGSAGNILLELNTSGTTYLRANVSGSFNTTFADANSLGFYVGSRISSTQEKVFKNGVLKATGVFTNTSFAVAPIYLAAWNTPPSTPRYYSSKNCTFSFIANGLTDAKIATLYNIVLAFNTTLGR